MPRIELAVGVGDDFERILEHASEHDGEDPVARVRELIAAIDVLGTSPLIGRPVTGELRELIVGRRSRGYVALYRYIAELDTVFVLAVRSQREAGYRGR
jgi:plasmid stabilization system protein ParE